MPLQSSDASEKEAKGAFLFFISHFVFLCWLGGATAEVKTMPSLWCPCRRRASLPGIIALTWEQQTCNMKPKVASVRLGLSVLLPQNKECRNMARTDMKLETDQNLLFRQKPAAL